jgi:uncharacterized protein (DUF983 family)
MPDRPVHSKGQPALRAAALFGLCPRCGGRTLFAGWTSFAPRCEACGLEFARFNVGDGPAAFLTLIVGAVVMMLAVSLQLAAEPPWWLHVLLWVPLTTVGVIAGLRLAKAALIWSEFRHRAQEAGRK